MGEREEYARGYLKGYEEALTEAWSDVLSLLGSSFSPHELRIIARTRKGMVGQAVESRRRELQKSTGALLPVREEATQKGIDLTEGDSILVREERPEKAFSVFNRLVDRGMRGMSVTRTDPFKAAARYGLDLTGCNAVWLTRIEKEEIREGEERVLVRSNLAKLSSEIREFLSQPGGGGVVLLEGLEYLVTQFDFRPVLKFIQMVREQVSYTSGFFIISADADAVDEREYRLLEKEMTLTM